MKKAFIVCLLVVLLLVVGCYGQKTETQPASPPTQTQTVGAEGAPSSESGAAAGAAVVISGFSFNPRELIVAKGTSVTWTNKEPTKHTIVSDDGKFESTTLAQGARWSYTFNEAGTFSYYCGIHPGMRGTIIVEG
jgi:plastocyanin